jgi:hypothetical protein
MSNRRGAGEPQPTDTTAKYCAYRGTDTTYGEKLDILAISKLLHLSAQMRIKLLNH